MARDLLGASDLQLGLMVNLCLQCRLYLSWFVLPDVFLKAEAVLLYTAVLYTA